MHIQGLPAMTVSFELAMIDSKIGLIKIYQCDLSSTGGPFIARKNGSKEKPCNEKSVL